MDKHQKKLLQLAIKFNDYCKKFKIWYSLDKQTLLEAVKISQFRKHSKNFEVFTDFHNFRLMENFFSSNIVSSNNNKKYKRLDAIFVNDKSNWNNNIFIRIRIAIPTLITKIKKQTKVTYFVLRKIMKIPNNILSTFDFLYETKYDGFYFLENYFSKDKTNWAINIDFKTENINFCNYLFPIISNCNEIIKFWYGKNWKSNQNIWDNCFYTTPLKQKFL